ncbi:MAG TPA: MBOAT family O-acyltransferase [Kofleriaceae bacterium]|nr:MBOAT family O-acyltransferase [Kofleriaceae bacterium]
MLFSSPDYPLFLIAVFFLYALARWGGPAMAWARICVMVLLGDAVFALVAKDPDALWDPIGGVLLRLAAGDGSPGTGALGTLAVHWAIGGAVLLAALATGRRAAGWIASDAGQAWIARGLVTVLAAVGATVALAWRADALDPTTAAIAAHGHLVVLAVLGVGIGATREPAHRPLGRVVILFVASALFYHAWAASMPGPYRYLLALLLGTIALDYYLGIWIERSESPARRRALVILSLCSNLGVLVVFKYTDFFTQDVLHLHVRRLHLILPAGISFHTFQSLSYTIDVYRRQLRATRSVIAFATFVLFFPQLVAGPIVRAQDLLPQLAELPALELEAATAGLFRIVVGLFKKIALADTLALALVDRVFEAPEHFSAIEVIAGVYGYALQIYLDFSAYSDIAIGSAQVLGFTLPENFRTPYRSANLQEFWRRWHISLSTWLRDYLYITLGGSQGAPWRTYLNLILTMLLGGLWHGASWAFVVWGALHGFGLAVTRYFQRRAGAGNGREAQRLLASCVAIAVIGLALQRAVLSGAGTWPQLVALWLCLTPLWAVLTAWLSREQPAPVDAAALVADEGLPWRSLFRRDPARPGLARGIGLRPWLPGLLRLAMCAAGAGFLAALAWAPHATWIPLLGLSWSLGIAADAVERGGRALRARLWADARRALSVVLVFHYVCLAWIFFRAASFDNALAVLRQIALAETDHANVVPIVATALAAGFACHLWGDASFGWLRRRFVALPAWAQGAVLAGAALVLRELGHAKIVPFIYFQF